MTLLKVFFHDMAQLDQLYRIAALVGMAIIAILSSVSISDLGQTHRLRLLRVDPPTPSPKNGIAPALACFGLKSSIHPLSMVLLGRP